jgi:hypothetical protein
MTNLLPNVRPVLAELTAMRPVGQTTGEERDYITVAKTRLVKIMTDSCDTVRKTLKVYDDAYSELTKNGQPKAFREFLLTAPNLFYELGERLGAIHHVVSFWRFRHPEGSIDRIKANEFVDLLSDFELSLGKPVERAARGGVWAA